MLYVQNFFNVFLLSIGEIFAPLINQVLSWISDLGYAGVFAAALLETIFPPIPSEVVFPLVGITVFQHGLGIEHAILMATIGALGSTLGSIIIYFLSARLGRNAILKLGRYTFITESKLLKAEKWFEKYGPAVVLLGRLVPGVREFISIPAGVVKMNIIRFVVFTFCGSLAWSISLTVVGYYVGETSIRMLS